MSSDSVPTAADTPAHTALSSTASPVSPAAPAAAPAPAPATPPAAPKSKDPLHGVTLERIVKELAEEYDWPGLADRVPVRCFQFDPSLKSSLTFLRKTPWARAKVERLWLDLQRHPHR
jgi:hypothetical protein